MNILDKLFWGLVWISSAGSWIAIQFFDWQPDPKFLAGSTFLAMQFAAGARMELFYKADKPDA